MKCFALFFNAVLMQPFSYVEKKVFKYFCCSYTTNTQEALFPQSLHVMCMAFAHNKVSKPRFNFFFLIEVETFPIPFFPLHIFLLFTQENFFTIPLLGMTFPLGSTPGSTLAVFFCSQPQGLLA